MHGRWIAIALGTGLSLAIPPAIVAGQDVISADSAEKQLELEAINLLQGQDTLPFLDPARIQLVIRALRTVRAQFPALRGIPAGHDYSFLVLYPQDSLDFIFASRAGATTPPPDADPDFYTVSVDHVGIAALDSLNAVFGVKRPEVRVYSGELSHLVLRFSPPVNTRVVSTIYQRVPEVALAWPGEMYTDGSEITLISKGPFLHFVFGRGGGDCPAGCTEWDFYYVTFDPRTGQASLEREWLNGSIWAEPIPYWGIPILFSISPYPTIDDLFRGMEDPRWWYRQDAVNALAALLGYRTGTLYEPGDRNPSHFTALKKTVQARYQESYEALIARLMDPDPSIARLARDYLLELTQQGFPGGAEGATKWREWLRSQAAPGG